MGSFLFEDDFVGAAGFGEADADAFGVSGGNVLADEIGFDGQLAVSAVNEDGKLDAPRAAEVIEGIHGGTDGATAKQDVIHEHDGLSGHIEGNNGWLDVGGRAPAQVIAVHAHIQVADGHGMAPDGRQFGAQPPAQRHAASLNAYGHEVAAVFVSLHDFMRNSGQRALKGGRVQDDCGVRHEGKVRNPKSEIRKKSEIRGPKS
jgi:hypothetical protein